MWEPAGAGSECGGPRRIMARYTCGMKRKLPAKSGRSTRSAASRKPVSLKVIVEKHSDGYVAYPLGLRGVVVGQGESYEDALSDVRSAIAFHIETFGAGAFADSSAALEAFVAEARIAG